MRDRRIHISIPLGAKTFSVMIHRDGAYRRYTPTESSMRRLEQLSYRQDKFDTYFSFFWHTPGLNIHIWPHKE